MHWVVFVLLGVLILGGVVYGTPLLIRYLQTRRWNCIKGELALTYDDGPDKITTVALLDLLDELEVVGTFYLVGFRGEQCPEVLDRLRDSRHQLGAHSHNHLHAWKTVPWKEYRDAMRGYQTLSAAVGASDAYRPPFGKISLVTMLGLWMHNRTVHWWNGDTNDTFDTFDDPDAVAKRMLDDGKTVLLMHCHHAEENRRNYVLILTRELITQARQRGLKFVTMNELGKPQQCFD